VFGGAGKVPECPLSAISFCKRRSPVEEKKALGKDQTGIGNLKTETCAKGPARCYSESCADEGRGLKGSVPHQKGNRQMRESNLQRGHGVGPKDLQSQKKRKRRPKKRGSGTGERFAAAPFLETPEKTAARKPSTNHHPSQPSPF